MMDVNVELCSPSGSEQYSPPPTVESVEEFLKRLSVGEHGTLQLQEAHQQMLLSGGPEVFNVLAIVGPDDFFDLVGDSSAVGSRLLIVGGQEIEVPARLCVSSVQALQAAWQFISSGSIPVSEQLWQRQGNRWGDE